MEKANDIGGAAVMAGTLVGEVHRGRLPWETGNPGPGLAVVDFDLDSYSEPDDWSEDEEAAWDEYVESQRARSPVETKAPPTKWLKANTRRMWNTGEALIPYLLRTVAWLKGLASSKWRLARWVGSLAGGITLVTSELRIYVDHADGTRTDYGVVSRHVVTTAGKNFIAGCFPNTNEPEVLKYHGFGTGTTAAAIGDTALQTEFTTEYATNSTRPTGSQSTTLAVYTTAATFAPDSGGTLAVTEHGILSQAATGGGTLLDRNVFSAINLVSAASNGDSLTTTYTLTIS